MSCANSRCATCSNLRRWGINRLGLVHIATPSSSLFSSEMFKVRSGFQSALAQPVLRMQLLVIRLHHLLLGGPLQLAQWHPLLSSYCQTHTLRWISVRHLCMSHEEDYERADEQDCKKEVGSFEESSCLSFSRWTILVASEFRGVQGASFQYSRLGEIASVLGPTEKT